MELQQRVSNLRKITDEFISRVINKERKDKGIEERIRGFEDIVYGRKKEFWKIFQRFLALKNWVNDYGASLLHENLSQEHLERVISGTEVIKDYRRRIKDKKMRKISDEVTRMINSFLSQSIRKAGLVYTPLGLVESEDLETIQALRDKLPSSVGLNEEFEKGLEYQKRMLKDFYKSQDHLLSVLDFQLCTLERKFSFEDELFTANLLYFLKRKNYKITPYLERFKKIVQRNSG
ncbi:MAG: hypothetical protein AMJ90_03215 [candidate division Zixibacteria bacterium SM23_73_2]|nr:MAG: hypothetical protein AMJ90_03215 [candidate division Zixibacteria bacterium SM23_73_2]